VVLRAVDLRAVVLRAVFLAAALRVVLRAVDFLAVDLRAVVFRAVDLRAVDFLAVVFLAPVDFLAVVRLAVDLRAVFFAAAGATVPPTFLGNGTVLTAIVTPNACAFPQLRQGFAARVARDNTTRLIVVAASSEETCVHLRCHAMKIRLLILLSMSSNTTQIVVRRTEEKFGNTTAKRPFRRCRALSRTVLRSLDAFAMSTIIAAMSTRCAPRRRRRRQVYCGQSNGLVLDDGDGSGVWLGDGRGGVVGFGALGLADGDAEIACRSGRCE
jgi:hypothetical protein